METHEYRRILLEMDKELYDGNIKGLKFLCYPFLPSKKNLLKLDSGWKIFEALEKSKIVGPDNVSYLAGVLRIIGRVDLASMIEPDDDDDVEEDSEGPRESRVCPFRTLLFQISEQLDSDEVTKLRHLYKKVPKKETIKDGTDLFTFMLQHNKISQKDLSLLKRLLGEIERKDLVEMVEQFTNQDATEKTSKKSWKFSTCVKKIKGVISKNKGEKQNLEVLSEKEGLRLKNSLASILTAVSDSAFHAEKEDVLTVLQEVDKMEKAIADYERCQQVKSIEGMLSEIKSLITIKQLAEEKKKKYDIKSFFCKKVPGVISNFITKATSV